MSDTKFTPGPWVVEPVNHDNDGGTLVRLTDYPNPNCVANVWGTESARTPNAEGIANAHLIAAAPDLYAALLVAELASEELCQGQDPANECWVTLATVRAALAKARGQS